MIKDYQTWEQYSHLYGRIESGNRDVTLPANLRGLIEREKPLSTANLTHELMLEIFLKTAQKLIPDFKVDKYNSEVIELLVQYIRKDERFLAHKSSFRFSKGICLRGPVGCGKTVLFKVLLELMRQLRFFTCLNHQLHLGKSESFTIIPSNDIVMRFCLDGYLIFQQWSNERKMEYFELIRGPLMVDDIGSESEAHYYGQKTNIISEIIQMRYDKASLTHGTSNLDIDCLKKAYGSRTYDRMVAMFNDIVITGASRRK